MQNIPNTELLARILEDEGPDFKDTACQVRATTLLYICNNILLAANEESDFINKYLTMYNERKTSKNKNLSIKTVKLAEDSILTLQKISKLELDADFKKYLECYIYLSVDHSKIPLIPNYLSTLMMLNYLKNTASLLLINLTRAENNQELIPYRYQKGFFRVLDINEQNENEGAIHIKMESYIPDSKEDLSIEKFFYETDYKVFIEAFKNYNIAVLIMMLAAAHPPCPKNIDDKSKYFLELDFPNVPEKNYDQPMESFDIDLDKASKEQYSRLLELADHHKLNHNKDKTIARPAISIKHIKYSTIFASLSKISKKNETIEKNLGVSHACN